MLERLLTRCEIAYENAATLSDEQFALIRRGGIGASDTSAILGAMDKFKDADDVLLSKLETKYTDEERAVSAKPVVKKGKMLEPLNLNWAAKLLGKEVIKPPHMYRLKDYPYLTVNYDGLAEIDSELVPIEAKFVSTYGDKYYNFENPDPVPCAFTAGTSNLEKLEEAAKKHGIPPYYLIQVQQQLMGTGASRAILSALRDKTWDLYLFTIPVYNWMQDWIAVECYQFWNKVQRSRRTA